MFLSESLHLTYDMIEREKKGNLASIWRQKLRYRTI